jgi:hypothetical protein
MPTNTYVALDTQTLGTAAASVTFSSIPSGYTDLVLVITAQASASSNLQMRFNGSSAAYYSNTGMRGYSTSTADSFRQTNLSSMTLTTVEDIGNPNTNIIIQIPNYSNTTTFKTALVRANQATAGTEAIVGLWRGTTGSDTPAITSITLLPGSGNLNVGSTFTIYGIAATSVGAKATGGDIYTDSSYYYHVFDANGTFTPTQNVTCDYLIVAGGGGGGSYGGGGGAGGLLTGTFAATTSTNYTASIGGGGAGGGTAGGSTGLPGSVGIDSIFNSVTAAGGGGGGGFSLAAGNGGSGGGGGIDTVSNTAGGTATPSGQGNAGGTGVGTATLNRSGGGGGGAGAVGSAAVATAGGNGGSGTSSFTSWLSATGFGQNVSGTYYIAGGGGGGLDTRGTSPSAGTGGIGGGANGTTTTSPPSAAPVNTGGGGGGGNYNSGFVAGGAGGSGIVIVRYLKA